MKSLKQTTILYIYFYYNILIFFYYIMIKYFYYILIFFINARICSYLIKKNMYDVTIFSSIYKQLLFGQHPTWQCSKCQFLNYLDTCESNPATFDKQPR